VGVPPGRGRQTSRPAGPSPRSDAVVRIPLPEHRAILQAVEACDPPAAAAAMRDHLRGAAARLDLAAAPAARLDLTSAAPPSKPLSKAAKPQADGQRPQAP